MKENGFPLVKERSRRYPAQTITDADNADNIALLGNTPAQTESLLHKSGKSSIWYRPPCERRQNNTCALIKEVTSPH